MDNDFQSFLILLGIAVVIGIGVWFLSSHNPIVPLLDHLKSLDWHGLLNIFPK